ncbi:unnamed protein product [Camellia sinensis]
MEIFRDSVLCFLLFLVILPPSIAQLSPSETRILFQIQQILEYPEALQGWKNWTSFCYLPQSPYLVIACSENHKTEFSLVGNRTSPPNPTFHQNPPQETCLFLRKLSLINSPSVHSSDLWGQLPTTINRLKSLEKLNISSNFISGEIPGSISVLTNLTSLVLADNLFNGSVPDMKSLQSLQEIDLSINRLGPEFPSMSTNLATIKLKNSSLRSGIPSQIKDFDLLQRFDVSGNKLVGPIPSPLFSLPSIQYLNLDDNQYNQLFDWEITRLHWIKRHQSNCTEFMELSDKWRFGISTPVFLLSERSIGGYSPNRNREGQSKGKRYFGGVVGAVFAVGLLILIIFRREKKKKKKKDDSFECNSFVLEKSSVRSEPAIDGRHVPQTMTMLLMGLPPYHVFTLEEMEDATNNFDPSNLAGKDLRDRGWLRDGLICLVKCLKLKQKHSQQSLQQHVEVISKLRHRHLVSVLGHCIVTYQNHHPNAASTVFIVLEHVANGSLRDHLTDWIKREYLKWPQRRRIAVGIARGIQFLHSGITPGMYGNDLKIENTLLDKTLTAKISSYNISLPSKRFSRVTIEIARSNRSFHSWHILTGIIKNCSQNHHEMPQQRFNLTSHH